MQAFFSDDRETLNAFRESLSEARFSTYLKMSKYDEILALELYHWNSLLCQSLYLPLQIWEISLRNKLSKFLIWKFGPKWPQDERLLRQLTISDKARLKEALGRQAQARGQQNVTTDSIVADLSAGFWVSLLSKSYDIPFSWRYNLQRVFPHEPQIARSDASAISGRLLELRNRIAHHEPILNLPLINARGDLDRLVKGMCGASHLYVSTVCTFSQVLSARPKRQPTDDKGPATASA